MKHIAKYLHIGMLFSLPFFAADCCEDSCSLDTTCSNVKTIFIPLSIGTDLSNQYHKIRYSDEEDYDCSSWYFDLDAKYIYSSTRNEKCLVNNLLGDSTLKFQGAFDSSNSSIIENVNQDTGVYTVNNRRKDKALASTYFGFSRNADFSIDLCPKIQNHKIDLQLAFGGEKFWIQFNAPIVYSKWQINKSGTPKTKGTLGSETLQDGDAGGQFSYTGGVLNYKSNRNTTSVPLADDDKLRIALGSDYDTDMTTNDNKASFSLNTGASIFGLGTFSTLTINGNKITGDGNYLNNTLGNKTTGSSFNVPKIISASTVTEGLGGYSPGNLIRTYNLFNFNNCSSDWKIADLGIQLGYDFYKCDSKHFGLYIKAIVPTGTEIDKTFAKQVFSPVIGNGKHFELGAGLSAHADLWSCDENNLVINLDGYLTHMFKKSQFRTFDKNDDPMSRYALVKQATSTNLKEPNDKFAYNYVLSPLGDFNNGYVDISVDIKGEAVLDLTYSHKNWDFGVGYNFSGQSKEKMNDCTESSTNGYLYGYKGYAYENAIVIEHKGEGKVPVYGRSDSNVIENSGNFKKAAYDYGLTAEHADHQTQESDFFRLPDFNRSGLMEGQISNKLFAHIDYVWSDCSWAPELGILGSMSFSPTSYKTAEYWDVGAKLGFSY